MWRKRFCAAFISASSVLIGVASAAAADALPAKAARVSPADGWSGWYVGGHVGYSRGSAQVTLSDPAPASSRDGFGALYGGVQGGYNHLLSSRWLLGVEADLTFPNYLDDDDVVAARATGTQTRVTEKVDFVGSLRGRVGHAFDRWLIYGTGGLAFTHGRFLQSPGVADDEDKALRTRTGWVVGAGAEVAIAPAWTARLEYLYSHFGNANVLFPSGARYQSEFDLHSIRVGLNRRLTGPGASGFKVDESSTEFPTWELHGQTTYIQQGYGRFRSPYIGEKSFTPWPQTRNIASATAFLGLRLWDGGEIYYNPELLQGFGLHDTTGAGGYPNGEAQKSAFSYPHYHTARLFLRQTFGFGGEKEKLESGPNQLSNTVDVSRLTVQAGKFPVVDVFDGNSYARDPRKDFMNWSIWAAGAFDYAADRVGLTYGAVADLNQKDWALRVGYFLTGAESNSNNFDMNIVRRGSYVAELETRYSLFSRPGKLRTIVWLNSTFSGSYRETLDNPGLNLDIAQTRRGRMKYGYVFNVEQSVTDDIGLFGRWSWNDGRNEIMSFTDIDASLSFGASIKGRAWGRPDDVIGIGAAFNALSKDHRDFLAAGGLSVLIGDGRLNYSQEKILETYYALAFYKRVTLTFDYQLLVNPAYNADRGPVSIFSARLHGEF